MRNAAKAVVTIAFAVVAIALRPEPAAALPSFSMQTGLQCDACHTSMRGLNELGDAYMRNGFRIGNLGAGKTPVVALRGQLAYTSEPDPSGLPKATVDEVEVFMAARLTQQISVAGQFYTTDGGVPGSTREAWVQYLSPGNFAGGPVRLTVGSITLPLPVDPETFRQTNNHYAIFDQTVGANTFAFIDPRNAASLGLGSPVRGPSATFVAAQGHDPHSGMPVTGTDRMIQVQEAVGGLVVSGYDYRGRRSLGAIDDAFKRQGVGLNLYRGRLAIETLLQTGFDTSPNGDGLGISSSGGYAQLRYQLPHATFALLRYDGVNDSEGNFSRSLTVGLTHLLTRGLRVGAEDVITHVPQAKHTLALTLGFGVSNTKVGSGAY
ncbi:MAG TPA: hypothetical protein VGN14_00815 [Candidatus Elarobacter sp.]|jgi:hypothetical protein